jgi:STE24 endopeptidase
LTPRRRDDEGVASAEDYFSPEEIERARAYHRPLYRFQLVAGAIGFAYLAVLSFTPLGGWLAAPVDGLPLWAEGLLYPALVVLLGAILWLPLSFWRGYVYEHRWGFSTQSRVGWLVDWGKGVGVSVAITSLALLAFVEIAAAFPRAWPVVAGAGAALLVVLLSLLGPVLLEPLFNRFRALEDTALDDDLRELARRAGAGVREILVADASRRTKKENAYVSGLGRTRRVVIFDTLLARAAVRDVRLVVAHELGHWRDRHMMKGTALAGAGAAAMVVILWALLQSDTVLHAISATGPADPQIAPFVLLVAAVLELVAQPFGAALSRRWESDADRASVELTGDREGFAAMTRGLAVSNLSDLAPGRLAYALLFSHPSPPERIAAALSS